MHNCYVYVTDFFFLIKFCWIISNCVVNLNEGL